MFFIVSLVAREEAFATNECPAFNNMKHTKNTHNITLDTSRKYTILRYHKGQALILIKGEQPAQRWVDEECFSRSTKTSKTPVAVPPEKSGILSIDDELEAADLKMKKRKPKVSSQNLLALSWHNAFCETHRYKKECKRSLLSFGKNKYSERHFVLHGLWPQPKNNTYCEVSSKYVSLDKHKQWHKIPHLGLKNELKMELQKVMPGYASNLHRHEWIKHGTCYGTDANAYYEDAVSLVTQVNVSKVGNFFKNNIGKRVTLQQVRGVFDRSFGIGSGKRVELKCKKGLITELWLHLGSGDERLAVLLKEGKITRSRCKGGLIDRAGF